MILIGSRALKLRIPHCFSRKTVDFDFVCTEEELKFWLENDGKKIKQDKSYYLDDGSKFIIEGDSICEFELVKPNTSSQLLYDLVRHDTDTIETSFGLIPSLDLLFTIKDSHKYKKFKYNMQGFWKTAYDWHLMNQIGAKVRPEYNEFHTMRKAEAYAGQKHPSLNQKKDDFFKDDAIFYKFNHDDIHKIVAINERPAYTYYLKDGAEVQCDKNKFFACDEHIRLSGCCEEALTLGLERAKIPHGIWNADKSFKFALAKTASSISSGFFRAYCFNNIFKVIDLYNKTSKNYFEKFDAAVASGKIREINE